MIRGYSFRDPNNPLRTEWEPVGFCDSRFLRTMMLQAWNPSAERDIRRGVYWEMFPGVPVVEVAETGPGETVELGAA